MEHQQSIDDLTYKDRSYIGEMISWETIHKVQYYEDEYRILQQDPRLSNNSEQKSLSQTRDILASKLNERKVREDNFSSMTYKYSNELFDVLFEYEVEEILKNNLELWYLLKELTETIIRFDIELVVDCITQWLSIIQSLYELQLLIDQANRYDMSYCEPEINLIQMYIQDHKYGNH